MNIKNLFEVTGLDLIPYAIGLSKFMSKPSFEPTKINDIIKNVQKLDAKKLDDALEYSKELLVEENMRGEKTESKAYNLIGITGISAAFITGISKLIPEKSFLTFPTLSILSLSICYMMIVVCLTLTVLLASRAVLVRSYTRPAIEDVFLMQKRSLKQSKIDRLATYIYCYGKNEQVHNIKLSYLIGAQLWFRNSVGFFLILALILSIILSGGGTYNSLGTTISTQTPNSIFTQTVSPIPTLKTITLQPTILQLPTTAKPSRTPTLSPAIATLSTETIDVINTKTP